MALTNTTLTTSAASIYTSPADDNVVTSAYFCNYSGATRTISVWAVASGGTANNTSIIYDTVTITAGDTYVMDLERLSLSSGDALFASASAVSSVVATVSTQAM